MDIDEIEKSCELGHKSNRIDINFDFFFFLLILLIHSIEVITLSFFEGSNWFIDEWSKMNGKLVVISICGLI